ncbi:MAG: cation transporter, partial [Deltaproteobacteria bacterium]|nr:cation transporter [Deltaproteobacteria bacterium]
KMNTKVREEIIACAAALSLAIGKGVAAWWTGALALFASALDSLADFFVSSVNLFSLMVAERPADEDHKFGHGKAEAIAALFQSLLIGGSVIFLVYSAGKRLLKGVRPDHLEGGMVVIFVSAAVSLWLTWRLNRRAAQTGSVVLKTDALHYAMDLYAYGGILVSFLLIRTTGWWFLDPLISLLMACYVGYLAHCLGRRAVDELMDREVDPSIRQKVTEIVMRYKPEIVGVHNFKSRQASSKIFLQFHLDMKSDLTFLQVHELEERIAGEIRREMGNVHVTIHADPEGHGLDQTDLM